MRYTEMSLAALSGAMTARGAFLDRMRAIFEIMTANSDGLDDAVELTPAAAAATSTAFSGWCVAVLKPGVQA